MYISTACNAEFYVVEVVGANSCFKISTEFYFERWSFDCCNVYVTDIAFADACGAVVKLTNNLMDI